MKHFFNFIFFNALCLSTINAQATFFKTISTSDQTNQVIGPGIEFNGYHYFTSGMSTGFSSTMWKTDGTPIGTNEFVYSNDLSAPTPIFVFKDELYYRASSTGGQKYYKTDGTTSTLFLEPTVEAPVVSIDIRTMAIINNTLIFRHGTVTTGYELYASDGSADNNPTLIKDIYPGNSSSLPIYFTKIANNKLVFRAEDDVHGIELWVTDGTTEGTNLVKELTPNGNTFLSGLTSFKGKAYFKLGNDIWETDGTDAGTKIFLNLRNDNNSEYPFYEYNNELYFTAYDSTFTKVDLWKTDGTVAGSTILASGLNFADTFQKTNNLLFFVAEDDVHGYELWRTDGTPNGTFLIRDINTGSEDSHPTEPSLGNGGDKLFFEAIYYNEEGNADPDLNRELWSSDGTEAGTTLNTTINTSSTSFFTGSSPDYFFNINDKLIFMADVDNSGTSDNKGINLWSVDTNILSITRDELSSIDFSLYPNPSSDIIAINDQNKAINEVEIFSIQGRKVKTVTSNFQAIQIQDLTTGAYIISLKLNNGRRNTLRLLKQ